MKRLLAILLMLLLSLQAWGRQIPQPTDPRRIEFGQRIVVGSARQDGNEWVVTAETVLKGSASPTTFRIKWKPQGEATAKVLWVEGTDDDQLYQFVYVTPGEFIWDLYHGVIDPAPLCNLAKYPENVETTQLLGYLFDPVRVTSRDAPQVAGQLGRAYATKSFPWAFKDVLDLRCQPDAADSNRLEVLSMSPDTPDTQSFRNLVIHHGTYPGIKPPLPRSFSLQIDTRPKGRSSVSFATASTYLRDRLKSPEPKIRRAAIEALARLRELAAVPEVIGMVHDTDPDTARTAVTFLQYSGDARAVEPLCRLLDSLPSPVEYSDLRSAVNRALAALRDPRATPYLERSVAAGDDNSCYPLMQVAREESMNALLASASNGKLSRDAVDTMFWLVRRSNKTAEPWMEPPSRTGPELRSIDVGEWESWWKENQSDFKFVISLEEATKRWQPPPVPRITASAVPADQRRWQVYFVIAVVGLVGALVIAKRRARARA